MKVLQLVGGATELHEGRSGGSSARRRRRRRVLVPSGQHFDANMSGIFFRGLDLPAPTGHCPTDGGTNRRQSAPAADFSCPPADTTVPAGLPCRLERAWSRRATKTLRPSSGTRPLSSRIQAAPWRNCPTSVRPTSRCETTRSGRSRSHLAPTGSSSGAWLGCQAMSVPCFMSGRPVRRRFLSETA